MSVRLRLRRMGKKKQPYYRIVAIDSRAARDGRYLENLGTYNPLRDPAEIQVKEDRALYWLSQGAIPSDTVRSFLRRKGILLKWHLMKQGAEEAVIEEEFKKWEALQAQRQKKLEALAEQKKREAAKAKKAAKAEEETAPEAVEVAAEEKAEAVAAAEQGESEQPVETAAEEAAAAPEEEAEKVEAAAPEAEAAPTEDVEEGKEETSPAEPDAEENKDKS